MGSDNKDKRSAGKGAGRTPGCRSASTEEPSPRPLRPPGKLEPSCAVVTPWAGIGALLNFSCLDSKRLSTIPALDAVAAGALGAFAVAGSVETAFASFGSGLLIGAAGGLTVSDLVDPC